MIIEPWPEDWSNHFQIYCGLYFLDKKIKTVDNKRVPCIGYFGLSEESFYFENSKALYKINIFYVKKERWKNNPINTFRCGVYRVEKTSHNRPWLPMSRCLDTKGSFKELCDIVDFIEKVIDSDYRGQYGKYADIEFECYLRAKEE